MAEQQPLFFETVTKSFEDVTITDAGVNTAEFCEAAENLVKIFGLLGSSAFTLVQNDLTGNIAKVRARLASHPAQSSTLEDLAKGEKAEKKKTATEGLLWLMRGLKFTALGLRSSLSNPKEELSESFTKAYEGSLKPHHSFVVRPVFALAMKACPYRATFYPKIGPEEKMDKWLTALERIVAKEEASFKAGGFGQI